MPDFRVHCDAPAGQADLLVLTPAESHHLVAVNRGRVADSVVAFDGAGHEWQTEIVQAHRKAAVLRIRQSREVAPLPCAFTLAQALPKGGVMDTIVRHATELGTARIVPLTTARSQVQLSGERAERKVDKWAVTALEAAKQCGNPWLPVIDPPTAIADFLADPTPRGLFLIASLAPEARPLGKICAEHGSNYSGTMPTRVTWLVGPEGDFTPEETAAAIAAGAIPVSLGPLVLRCDTAATVALGTLRQWFA